MNTYPKWEAYQRLVERVPLRYLARHELCSDVDALRDAWPLLRDDDDRVSFRTDVPGGGISLPFKARATFDDSVDVLARAQAMDPRAVAMPCECIYAEVNGKVEVLDDDTMLVEWALCDTARDFDVARVDRVASFAMGPYGNAVLTDAGPVIRCIDPHTAEGLYGNQLATLYSVVLESGLPETCWCHSLTGRLVLWG